MTNKEYLDAFEAKLINELLNLCKSYNTLDNILLATEDINQRWDAIAPEYMADSVKEIAALLGFSEPNTFIHFFKYHEGISPTLYRNTYHNTHMNKQ